MEEWVAIDPTGLNTAEHRAGVFEGAEITEGLSPDYIPEKIGGTASTGGYVIRFKYPNLFSEDKITVRSVTGELALVGVHSGRLYELRLPQGTAPQVSQFADGAIASLSKDNRFLRFRRHYRVAGKAVSENVAALLAK